MCEYLYIHVNIHSTHPYISKQTFILDAINQVDSIIIIIMFYFALQKKPYSNCAFYLLQFSLGVFCCVHLPLQHAIAEQAISISCFSHQWKAF